MIGHGGRQDDIIRYGVTDSYKNQEDVVHTIDSMLTTLLRHIHVAALMLDRRGHFRRHR
jgi:hypothetical protein